MIHCCSLSKFSISLSRIFYHPILPHKLGFLRISYSSKSNPTVQPWFPIQSPPLRFLPPQTLRTQAKRRGYGFDYDYDFGFAFAFQFCVLYAFCYKLLLNLTYVILCIFQTNRSAKLKQYKIDARREQWLSQGM